MSWGAMGPYSFKTPVWPWRTIRCIPSPWAWKPCRGVESWRGAVKAAPYTVQFSWGRETPHVFTRGIIEHALKAFCDTQDYGTILRAKGMVPSEDGTWIYFDMVDGEYELRTGEADYTGRLCVIFVNDKNLMHFSYTRYIENQIREAFGFRGTPLKFIIRERKENR